MDTSHLAVRVRDRCDSLLDALLALSLPDVASGGLYAEGEVGPSAWVFFRESQIAAAIVPKRDKEKEGGKEWRC